MNAAGDAGCTCRPIFPIMVRVSDRAVATYATIDSGANCTGIVPELVRRLDMEVELKMKTVSVLDWKTTAERESVSFEITALDGNVCIKVKDALVSDILPTANNKPPTNEEVEGLDYMERIVSIQELYDKLVGILLPVQACRAWLGGETIQGSPNQMMALKTKFGWNLLGPSPSDEDEEEAFKCCVVEDGSLMDLRDDNNHMFRYDFLPRPGEETKLVVKYPSRQDESALKQIEDSIEFDETRSHSSCGLAWVQERIAAAKNLD
jgi:hypothetical protein